MSKNYKTVEGKTMELNYLVAEAYWLKFHIFCKDLCIIYGGFAKVKGWDFVNGIKAKMLMYLTDLRS